MIKATPLLIAAAAGAIALGVAACAEAQSGGPAQTVAPAASAPAQAAPVAPAASTMAPAAPAAPPADQTASKPAAEGSAPGAAAKLTPDETNAAIAILGGRCTACHGADQITSQTFDQAGWKNVLDDMGMASNAGLSPSEESLVLRYLVENYGPK